MKTVIRKIRGDRVDDALPPEYRHRVPPGLTGADANLTVLLFPGTEETVVRSKDVRKGLARVDLGSLIVAVAGNYTEEARQALSEREAVIVTLRDTHWTDEEHATLRERFFKARHGR